MMKFLLYFAMALFLNVSCQEILFNDNEETREINLDSFNAARIEGIYNIVLIQDSTDKIIITGKNNIKSIEASVQNDTLLVEDNRSMSINPGRNTLELHFSNLNYMVTFGPVNVSNRDTIKAGRFTYDAIGEISEVKLEIDCEYLILCNSANTLGYFYLSGNSEYCSFFNRYGCSIFAQGLSCKVAEITNESIGDVHINATGHIRAYIWGPGNIYYYGDPLAEVAERVGSGNLIKHQ